MVRYRQYKKIIKGWITLFLKEDQEFRDGYDQTVIAVSLYIKISDDADVTIFLRKKDDETMKPITFVKRFIQAETNPNRLHDGVRQLLSEMDRQGCYPEDCDIKQLQRLVDLRYEELTGGRNE